MKETNVGFINIHTIGTFAQALSSPNLDLGDWLCKMLGICA
ncbi:hypothetical protein [Salinibacterium sp. M195]|nr:hypothetical protein [Salinibacterium sp. M195]